MANESASAGAADESIEDSGIGPGHNGSAKVG
jgi:hypothetical protein